MKLLASVCGVVVILTIVCAATAQDKDEGKKDLDKMQGSWRVVSSQMAEEKATEDEVKKRKITVKGNTLTYETGNERKEKRKGTIKLISSVVPMFFPSLWRKPGRRRPVPFC